MKLTWKIRETPVELHSMLETLGEEYAIEKTSGTANLKFNFAPNTKQLRVAKNGETWEISYGKTFHAARGVAYALSEQEAEEKIWLKTNAILLDCTRGNIVTVNGFKRWLRRLALLGYNMAMIYVKDAYQVPDEPYFGYMRGAYSLQEIREIDSYASKLGIEMIASIQALGHLEPLMRWKHFAEVRDTASVILVDEPKSYVLLEKMIKFWSDALSSRRIHLGLDETHDLGKGRFADLHGDENPFEIYNRHLGKLGEICEKLGLQPIIWSDMFFRYAATTRADYDVNVRDCYNLHTEVPEAVKKAIPKNIQLSYWDYYYRGVDRYAGMLKKTEDLNNKKPFMASAIWTWGEFWTDYEMTRATTGPCLEACEKNGVDEIVFTMWGDDGGYCEFDSAFAGLAWVADKAFNTTADETRIAKIFQAVCGSDYFRQLIGGDLTYTFKKADKFVKIHTSALLWDDPIYGIFRHELEAYDPELPRKLLANLRELMAKIEPNRDDNRAGDLNYAWNVANVAAQKLEIRLKLEIAYKKRDFYALSTLNEEAICDVIDAIEGLMDSYRIQWTKKFKTYGMELTQIRLGGLVERYRELATEINELINGEIDSIPALEELNFATRGDTEFHYHALATGGFFI